MKERAKFFFFRRCDCMFFATEPGAGSSQVAASKSEIITDSPAAFPHTRHDAMRCAGILKAKRRHGVGEILVHPAVWRRARPAGRISAVFGTRKMAEGAARYRGISGLLADELKQRARELRTRVHRGVSRCEKPRRYRIAAAQQRRHGAAQPHGALGAWWSMKRSDYGCPVVVGNICEVRAGTGSRGTLRDIRFPWAMSARCAQPCYPRRGCPETRVSAAERCLQLDWTIHTATCGG